MPILLIQNGINSIPVIHIGYCSGCVRTRYIQSHTMTQTSKFDPRGPLPTKPRGAPRRPLATLLSRYEVSSSGCWEWTGAKNGHGYGLLNMLIDQRQTTFAPHRLQWMHTHGEIPPGMVVMHVCDNRACVRPDHLVLGTQQANLADMRAKGRGNATGLKNFGQSMAARYSGI